MFELVSNRRELWERSPNLVKEDALKANWNERLKVDVIERVYAILLDTVKESI
jgi:hypothetical protein